VRLRAAGADGAAGLRTIPFKWYYQPREVTVDDSPVRTSTTEGVAMSGNDHEVTLYDPTAEPRILAAGRAKRVDSLAGKKIAILDNSKANAGTLMLAVAKRLQERYGAGAVVKREKGIAGAPSPTILEALTTCDVALVGSAD